MDHFHQIAQALPVYGLDAMLLTGEANRFYASGFHSTGSDGVALVTAAGNYYFTDARYTEAAGRVITGAEIRETHPGQGYPVLVKEVVERHGVQTLGFEERSMTVAEHGLYQGALDCKLKPAAALVETLRQTKEPEELARITAAQEITDRAFAEIIKELRPGVTERETAARLQYLMLSMGAEKMSFDPIVVAGENGSLPHGVPSDRPLQAGELVTMDFGCIYQGYCSDMTRTVALGSVSEEMRRVYDTVLAAQAAGIAAARAGVTGKAVDGAARQVIEAAGYGPYFGHGFGHGVGVEIHEAPNASSRNETPLPAGAVISAEPGIYLPGKLGVRIEDLLILHEDGATDITRSTKELLIL